MVRRGTDWRGTARVSTTRDWLVLPGGIECAYPSARLPNHSYMSVRTAYQSEMELCYVFSLARYDIITYLHNLL